MTQVVKNLKVNLIFIVSCDICITKAWCCFVQMLCPKMDQNFSMCDSLPFFWILLRLMYVYQIQPRYLKNMIPILISQFPKKITLKRALKEMSHFFTAGHYIWTQQNQFIKNCSLKWLETSSHIFVEESYSYYLTFLLFRYFSIGNFDMWFSPFKSGSLHLNGAVSITISLFGLTSVYPSRPD